MIDNNSTTDGSFGDDEIENELEGIPDSLLDQEPDEDEEDDDSSNSEEQIIELEEKVEATKQEVLYAKAETQNLRRRMEKDVADARAYAATGFARDVLSVADNLARAIDAVPEELRADDKFKGLVAGIEATQRELEKTFSQNNITRIASMGLPLDPNQHQAMMEMPSDDVEPGTIIQEMQSGYMIKDRLLRPAMVAVAKKP